MQSRRGLRLVACIAPPLALLAAGLSVSCRDVNNPSAVAVDEWAEVALVSMTMRTKISLVTKAGPREVQSISQPISMHVLKGYASGASSRGADGRMSAGRIEVRHIRDKLGRRRSVGLYFDHPTMPPKFVYTFDNGRIESILSAGYTRKGNGFIRSKSRLTLFDSTGVATVQIDAAPEQTATITALSMPAAGMVSPAALPESPSFSAMAARAVRDVSDLFLPRNLYADESEQLGKCFAENLAFISASFGLAAANTALGALAVACPATAAACLGIPGAIAAVASAINSWSMALDKLLECTQRNEDVPRSNDTGGSGSGTGSGSPSGDDSSDSVSSSLTNAIKEFIQTAVDSGNVSCTDDDSSCVYY